MWLTDMSYWQVRGHSPISEADEFVLSLWCCTGCICSAAPQHRFEDPPFWWKPRYWPCWVLRHVLFVWQFIFHTDDFLNLPFHKVVQSLANLFLNGPRVSISVRPCNWMNRWLAASGAAVFFFFETLQRWCSAWHRSWPRCDPLLTWRAGPFENPIFLTDTVNLFVHSRVSRSLAQRKRLAAAWKASDVGLKQ